MIARITPGTLSGTVPAIASKSVAHRVIIAAALANGTTHVVCNTTCADIDATIRCLETLGARVERVEDGFRVHPIPKSQEHGILRALAGGTLDCGESGSTLRFMLPVACALGADATFTGARRLGERPLDPLDRELIAAGCELEGLGALPLTARGRLRPGRFELPGDVSSQFISGLLLACPLLGQPSEIRVTGRIESKPYVTLTLQALASFGVPVEVEHAFVSDTEVTCYRLDGSAYRTPGEVSVEGDWSNAAFWLCAGAMGTEPITVTGLSLSSAQGDRTVMAALSRFGARMRRGTGSATAQPDHLNAFTLSAQDVPDLVPILAAVASVAHGRTIIQDCRKPPPEGIRPPRHHGRRAHRARRAGARGRRRPPHPGRRGAFRRRGRGAQRPPHRHDGGHRRHTMHWPGRDLRRRGRGQILPALLRTLPRARRQGRAHRRVRGRYGIDIRHRHPPLDLRPIPFAGHRLLARRDPCGHPRRCRGAPALPRPPRARPRRHRHAPGEADAPEWLSGIVDGHTTGAPIAAIIHNTDTRSQDYDGLRRVPRPGHADFTARVKYGNWHDVAGGGHFSGRLTAPLCIAGGIALQALATMGIDIAAHIQSLGPEGIADEPLDELERDEAQLAALRAHDFPCISTDAAGRMRAAILAARDDLDSIGGVIECAAYGVPAGVGDPMFDGLENRIARIAFGIPAVKGVDFGSGFAAAYLTGSENNDPFRMVDGQTRPETNNAGGILGGISTGVPIVWRMAVKPTASIGREQQTRGPRRQRECRAHGPRPPRSLHRPARRARSRSSRSARLPRRAARGRPLPHPGSPKLIPR